MVANSCAAEGIDDGITGFLCQENAYSIASQIDKIIDNKSLLSQVGENAKNNIYISWEESIKNAYDRYQVVIDKFNSSPKEPYKY